MEGGAEDVDLVDEEGFGETDAKDDLGVGGDLCEQLFPFRGGELFAVVEVFELMVFGEDASGGDDRPCERPSPRFIDSGDSAESALPGMLLKPIGNQVAGSAGTSGVSSGDSIIAPPRSSFTFAAFPEAPRK